MSTTRSAAFSIAVIGRTLSRAELARLIGLPADEGWSEGDPWIRPGTDGVYQFTRWAVTERGSGEDNDWSEAIDKLFSRVRTVAPKLHSLPAELVVKFEVDLTEYSGVFGFGLSLEQALFVASIRAALDVSVVVYV